MAPGYSRSRISAAPAPPSIPRRHRTRSTMQLVSTPVSGFRLSCIRVTSSTG